jgi:hypothetical protein
VARTIKLPFVLVWEFLERVWAYLPILWHDRDWDYAFILRLLKFKLERTRKRIVANDFISEAGRVGKEIQHAENLIDRFLNDDYCKAEFQTHEEKWGKRTTTFTPHSSGLGSIMGYTRDNAKTAVDYEQERNEIRALYEKSDQEKDRDWKELWAHLEHKMRGFWD